MYGWVTHVENTKYGTCIVEMDMHALYTILRALKDGKAHVRARQLDPDAFVSSDEFVGTWTSYSEVAHDVGDVIDAASGTDLRS